jgi:hypothetical protein
MGDNEGSEDGMTVRVLERMLAVAVRAVMAVLEGSATVANKATMCGRLFPIELLGS